MSLARQPARTLATATAVARGLIGVTAWVAPPAVLRPWIGSSASRPDVGLLARAMGGRDLALGVGALLALRHDAPVRGWLEAGALADAGDLLATGLAFRHLPRRGRWLVLSAAAGGVALTRLAAPSVDAPPHEGT